MVSRTTGLAAHRRARQGLRRDPLQSDNARTTIFDDREDDGGKSVSERRGAARAPVSELLQPWSSKCSVRPMKERIGWFVGAVSLCAGVVSCGMHPASPALTAAHTGCDARTIKISDRTNDFRSEAWLWKASCNGKQYNCSRMKEVTTCTEVQVATTSTTVANAPGSAAAPESSRSGCGYDTQCKGDRICENGACVAPK